MGVWRIATHLLVAAAIALARLPTPLAAMLLLVVAASLWLGLRREQRRGRWVLTPLTADDWHLRYHDREERGRVCGGRVFRHLVTLRFRVEGRRWPRTIAIAADAVPADVHRRLRAWLNLREGDRQ